MAVRMDEAFPCSIKACLDKWANVEGGLCVTNFFGHHLHWLEHPGVLNEDRNALDTMALIAFITFSVQNN